MPAPVKINNPEAQNPRVLVAPLDWGLGHATRCIPIIKELLNQRCEVIIATSGAQKLLLLGEFPSLTYVDLPGYGIKYDKNRALTILRLIRSIPKILIRVKRERAWLSGFAARERLDLVISDNRYGLAAPGIYCILVTHQLLIRTPFGGMADGLLQRVSYRVIRRFSRCWVPDIEGGESLGGELSHPKRMPPVATRYIGWLSRFGGQREEEAGDGVLVLLSGPEPQRTMLERLILRQAGVCACRLVLVRGLPEGGVQLADIPPGVAVYDHLPAEALEEQMRRAGFIIARPGYSTVMDLVRLGKRALLVPTPGQTEQEYLGPYLAKKGWAVCVEQPAFSLADALRMAREGGGSRRIVAELPGQLRDEIALVLAKATQSDWPALG